MLSPVRSKDGKLPASMSLPDDLHGRAQRAQCSSGTQDGEVGGQEGQDADAARPHAQEVGLLELVQWHKEQGYEAIRRRHPEGVYAQLRFGQKIGVELDVEKLDNNDNAARDRDVGRLPCLAPPRRLVVAEIIQAAFQAAGGFAKGAQLIVTADGTGWTGSPRLPKDGLFGHTDHGTARHPALASAASYCVRKPTRRSWPAMEAPGARSKRRAAPSATGGCRRA